MHSLVTFIILYVCESWTITVELQRKNTSHGNEVLPQDTAHLVQRLYYPRGSPCQHPAGNRTTRRRPDHRKETQTNYSGVDSSPVHQVWPKPSCKAQRKGEGEKADRRKLGRQHQEMDRPGVHKVPERRKEQRKMEKLVMKSSVVPR